MPFQPGNPYAGGKNNKRAAKPESERSKPRSFKFTDNEYQTLVIGLAKLR